MKERRSISNDKLVSLEDGLASNVEASYVKRMMGTTISCKHLVECIKFLLYFELLLFVGWASYTMLETFSVASMEDKVTDSIRNSESHNSHSQQLPYEETTIMPSDFLAKMENLFQTENALEKTLEEQFEKQLNSDETNMNFVKTTESYSEKFEEDYTITERLPLLKIGVPKLLEVEMEKNLETNESEDTNSDSSKSEDTNPNSSKSEETVLVWNFGFLPFPNIYNIKEQSQSSTSDSDKSKSTEIAEKLLEMDNDRAKNDDTDEKTSALIDQMLLSLILQKALRDAHMMNSSEEDMDPKLQEQLSEMNRDDTPFMTSSQIDSASEDWKDDSVYDDIIINRSVRENTNDRTLRDFIERNQDFIGSDFIEASPSDFGDVQAVVKGFSEAISKQNFEQDMSSWISGSDKVYDPPVFSEADFSWTGLIDKRSIPDVSMDQELPNMGVKNVEGFYERLVPQLPSELNQNNVMTRLRPEIGETTNNRGKIVTYSVRK